MPSLSIQKLRPNLLDEVIKLERRTNPAAWSEASFRAELRNPQATYYVALSGKELVGFGGYWTIVDEAHITTLAVHEGHRRQGVGRRLMEELLKDAREAGMRCSTLEVRAGNEAAISLYERLGYVRCGVRKGYYPDNREDAVVMWLYGLDGKETA